MKARQTIIIAIISLFVLGCGEKAVEPTVEAPPSKDGTVQNHEAPLMGQDTATKEGG